MLAIVAYTVLKIPSQLCGIKPKKHGWLTTSNLSSIMKNLNKITDHEVSLSLLKATISSIKYPYNFEDE